MILCAGESLIDMVPDTAGRFAALAGGAVYNTAVALGRLGEDTGYLWPISRDGFGPLLRRPLTEAGVDTSLCPCSDLPTTLAVVSLEGAEARYSFYDRDTAGRMFSAADLPATLPPQVQALFVGGISLVGDPCGATVETLVSRHHRQCAVMIDPNIRAGFIPDAAVFRARLARLLAMADIVKVSSDDLAWLYPGATPETAAAILRDEGASIVLCTGGASGAIAFGPHGVIVKASAVAVTPVDTIGAGDTFNAGVIAGLRRQGVLSKPGLEDITGSQLLAALQLGARAASITVSRAGANPPWAHELPG